VCGAIELDRRARIAGYRPKGGSCGRLVRLRDPTSSVRAVARPFARPNVIPDASQSDDRARVSSMPLIEIKYFEDEFSDQECASIIGAVTDAMVAFTGESIRPHTWVVIEEIKSGNWGIGGAALGLADVRAIQAAGSGNPVQS
jgi:4-oxalocrotonate tautomerase